MTTYLRKATDDDLLEINKIIDSAKLLLKANEINQWQDGYPDLETLHHDIEQQVCYVLIVDQQIAGVGVILQDKDPGYEKIVQGSWLDSDQSTYRSIHRVALSPDFRGQHLSATLMNHLITAARLAGSTDLRIDTHPENNAMQRVIQKSGFDYRGVIYLERSHDKRWAYQLLLS
ncbi:GNAT family N-acetyltransferase [Sporolactobacillus kofuensis]|uniref:GNAT family N-acetyltransferase n=1 Tax=Sporolactobacillus kofuensis TaxID=269672 RepID=A0ABW1WCD8_9BACL|nr:GNAT family N-acetyltransferase [Sporolactobacillus kofuensis]MCO7174965.1 GNAT family N-acetyltransferase [Sporolactobacillus kofuensis]